MAYTPDSMDTTHTFFYTTSDQLSLVSEPGYFDGAHIGAGDLIDVSVLDENERLLETARLVVRSYDDKVVTAEVYAIQFPAGGSQGEETLP